LLASVGAALCLRAGVINIGAESQIAIGAGAAALARGLSNAPTLVAIVAR
jgi:ABC-type uncharacterized transport system permease subunit